MADDLLARVETLLRDGSGKLPPVQLWNPPLSGDIDIRIARNGDWYHEGSRFERIALVKLFSSILKREGDDYFLVTPVEKWRIRVEDVPFLAVDCEVLGEGKSQQLVFTTNLDERVHCNAVHPLRVVTDPLTDEPSPYVMVRNGLEARLSRSVFYRLASVVTHASDPMGLYSGGQYFTLA